MLSLLFSQHVLAFFQPVLAFESSFITLTCSLTISVINQKQLFSSSKLSICKIWTSIRALKFLCKSMVLMLCPSALLAIPTYHKHYFFCACVCVCSKSTGVLPARIRVLAMKQTVRDWSPSEPLPHHPPLPNYKTVFDFRPRLPGAFSLVWEKPPPLASQSPFSPSAHSYPPIRLLSSVKTQQSHNAMLYNRGSSHTHTHIQTNWGFHSWNCMSTSPHSSLPLRTHTHAHTSANEPPCFLPVQPISAEFMWFPNISIRIH